MRSTTLIPLAVASSLLLACGSSASKSSTPACDLMRPAFVENEHERAGADARTRTLPDAERQKVIDTAVDTAMSVCVGDHWTEAMVKCLLAKPRAKGSECGFPPPGFHHLNTAVEATYAHAYGPPKEQLDDYTSWAGQHSAEHRNADGTPELSPDGKDHTALHAGSAAGSAAAPAGSAAAAPAPTGW